MKNNKFFLMTVSTILLTVSLAACGGSNSSHEQSSSRPLEIGDTVREWTSPDDLEELPIDVCAETNIGAGEGQIVDDFGNEDDDSLYFEAIVGTGGEGYVGSDILKTPYFKEEDAKNGDIVSLYFYAPVDSNLASLQLSVLPSSMNNAIKSDLKTIDEETEDRWIRLMISFDTLETFGAIRLLYKVVDTNLSACFYVDDINITLGEETVVTNYEYLGESLYETYEDYFKIGTCLSSRTLNNTKIRQLTKDNFNSITAENEGKPEQILDQTACQALLGEDPSGVAIKITPFEKIYDFAEANHIGVRHHTFVWYSQTPAWFFNTNYQQSGTKANAALMLQRMENFIKVTLETINERWPGLVYAIDVSNEAIENGGVRTNNNNWYSTVGSDFVYHAFEYASLYKDEEQKLYYNDFSFDYNSSNCEFAVNTLLKDAIDEGLIDGVGIQGHVDSTNTGVMENLMTDARMIKAKGLECQITELDITVNGNNTTNLDTQKNAYKDLMTKILTNNESGETNIDAVILWGTTDNTSWKSGQYPLIFDNNYGKKPAYYGMLEALDEYLYPEGIVEE